MRVNSDRRLHFPVPRSELWEALNQVDRYPAWWPWMRDFDAIALKPGARWRCQIHPPLPYTLRLVIAIDDVVPERSVTATVTGDVEGSATLDLLDADGGSEARLVSALAPSSRMLQIIARTAPPVARFCHDWVLDTGAVQFRDRAF